MAKRESKILSRSSSILGSEEDKGPFCQPCFQSSLKLSAIGYCIDCSEHLCQSCFINHKKAKPCRNHTLLDEDAMPKTQQLSTSASDLAQTFNLTKPCPKHKNKIIKYFCQKHKAILCSVCGMLEHRLCQIKYIPDIAEETVYTNQYSLANKHLEELLSQCQNIKLESKKATEESNSSLQDSLAELKAVRQKVTESFDELEKNLKEEIAFLEEDNNNRLQTIEETCKEIEESLTTLLRSFKQMSKNRQADKLFVELKTTEHIIVNNESAVRKLSEKTFIQKFKLYEHTRNQISEFADMIKTFHVLANGPVKTICVKAATDRNVCNIKGMVVQQNNLILLDTGNQSIKMVKNNSNTVDSVKLPAEPYDITALTLDEFAVTLPSAKTIQIISSTANSLCLHHNFQVDTECYGISCIQGNLVVILISDYYDADFLMLDKKGNVLRKAKLREYKFIFSMYNMSGQCYAQSKNNAIYVKDFDKKIIVMLLSGQHHVTEGHIYEGFSERGGLAMHQNGKVFISNSEMGCVLELSSHCSQKEVILKDLNSPSAMCCDEKHLYISSCSNTETHANTEIVEVYSL